MKFLAPGIYSNNDSIVSMSEFVLNSKSLVAGVVERKASLWILSEDGEEVLAFIKHEDLVAVIKNTEVFGK